jgi:1,4-alpha-glucan branching enzyme
MNKRNEKINEHSHGNARHAVHVEFSQTTATVVAIAGTFNEWRPEATPMINMGQGRGLKELTLPPVTYEYLFVVDGRWLPDPLAQATTQSFRRREFGCYRS